MQTLFLKGVSIKAKDGEDFYEITTSKAVGKQVNSVGHLSEIGKIGQIYAKLQEQIMEYFAKQAEKYYKVPYFDNFSISLREKKKTVVDADGKKSKEIVWAMNFTAVLQGVENYKIGFQSAKELSLELFNPMWAEISQTIIELDGEVFENIDAIKNYKF